MRVLINTCVISEVRRPRGNRRVRTTLESFPDADLFLSVVTLGELSKGIALLPTGKKQDALTQWLLAIRQLYDDRVLHIDAECALVWGDLTAAAQRSGVTIPAADGLIAATALRHGLTVMTRNSRHFEAAGVRLIDPWSSEQ